MSRSFRQRIERLERAIQAETAPPREQPLAERDALIRQQAEEIETLRRAFVAAAAERDALRKQVQQAEQQRQEGRAFCPGDLVRINEKANTPRNRGRRGIVEQVGRGGVSVSVQFDDDSWPPVWFRAEVVEPLTP